MREKIKQKEDRLQKLISDAEGLWEETGLDPKDPSYLVEKTMRFEVAQRDISVIFSSFKGLVEDYKKLCEELGRPEE